jgi:hypothetical protein
MRPFDDVPAIEQLAVLSAFLGQLIAMQDSTKYDSQRVMALVSNNIQMGNAQVITAVAMGAIKP